MFETALDYIARTNLFNFIIFACIIGFVIVKLNIKDGLQNGIDAVSKEIEDSKTAKLESEETLQNIQSKIAGIGDEIANIINQSAENANKIGCQILADADKSVENINAGTNKLIENKSDIIKNDIMKRVSIASIEIAREQIKNALNQNYELHNKLIDESVEAVNGVNI